jgi:hypothetical protein
MSLPILVAQDKWQEFDDAWNSLMAGTDPIDDLLQALRQVASKKKMPRCLPMVKEHAELLAAGERNADAARLVGAAISGGAPPGELGDLLVQSATAAWSTDPEWKVFCDVTGFGDQGDLRSAWDSFERLKSFHKACQSPRRMRAPGGCLVERPKASAPAASCATGPVDGRAARPGRGQSRLRPARRRAVPAARAHRGATTGSGAGRAGRCARFPSAGRAALRASKAP